MPLTVRYRNGAPSNATLTDSNGNGLLVELFPLFNWYVAEADTTRFKQTGVHIVVDGGGKPDTTGAGAGLWTSTYPTGESSERTELPGALTLRRAELHQPAQPRGLGPHAVRPG